MRLFAQRALILSGFIVFSLLTFHAQKDAATVEEWLFVLVASLATTLILIAPVWLFSGIGQKLFPSARLVHIIATVFYFATVLLVISDYKLYALYGFHINSFVINLVFTPGGIESLGASEHFYQTIALAITVTALVYFLLIRYVPFDHLLPEKIRSTAFWLVLFGTSFLGQSYAYALAEYKYGKNILVIAEHIAFHIPVTSKKLFKKLGVEKPPRPDGSSVSLHSGKLNYPLNALSVKTDSATPNILWLVAESLRWDMLDAEIMPNTWAFSQRGLNALQHYSGGNGTRMGMFSMFYSLHGSYWFDALRERKQPALFDVLGQLAYKRKAITSAKFSYPEFDQTIFSGFSSDELSAQNGGPGWKRDRQNVDELLRFIGQESYPYFAFMFFESPHANYYFPEESVIRSDYLPELNYATMDLEKDSQLIKNRYINASHHLDQQFGRIIAELERTGQIDNTIVIITGDHGEEFMEKGHWGHNSTFVQEQIHVPMIIVGPGIAPSQLRKMSSHIDLVPTVLQQLGVTNPVSDYGFGRNMLSPDFNRQYSIVTDWHGPALIGHDSKFILSKKSMTRGTPFTTIDDKAQPYDDVSASDRQSLALFMQEYGRFLQR